ncbi:MAG TPA: L-seryl-tRNA(Sec) selenium transferase [Vicinamibacterales bacterium]|jgi:L-seryl-tRNA(Ser) seleniumtransferase
MPHYRYIPSIEQMRRRPAVAALERDFGPGTIVEALRTGAAELRAALGRDDAAGTTGVHDQESAAIFIERHATLRLHHLGRPSLRPVVNATGVIVHTNLGRAPLASPVVTRLNTLLPGYSNLEYDVVTGARGRRDVHAEALLCHLLGVEAAVVVNNNAAATLLLLAALAAGREVVVSRGELVEIGGGFRVPDVMAQSGARLREVGTTNRTRIEDYRAAIGPDTALLLRVHRSNFRIEGFTEQPTIDELVSLGREHAVPVVEDIGSGYLGLPGESDDARLDALLRGEPRVPTSLAAGVDLICFSGDKLLGGPQAGIIAGRTDLLAPIRRHPLMRALRVDKLTYAALEATLGEYVAGRASRTIPALRMILLSTEEIGARATALADALRPVPGLRVELIDGQSTVGGGSTPGLEFPTRLLALTHAVRSANWIDEHLRRREPPVVGRIEKDRLLLDLRTVQPDQDDVVATALAELPYRGSARTPR